jgi:LAO/AO transport system kinase
MSEKDSYKPDWAPKMDNDAFSVRIKKGVRKSSEGGAGRLKSNLKRKDLAVEEYVDGVLNGDKTVLARAITLIESNAVDHYDKAREVLKKILPHSGQSLRIGITGIPGSGKSTFIDTFGCFLINAGFNVAVLAVDPSSKATKGSILGDKTRMERLAREANCFIRPSPTGGTLGGVTRKSRETMLLCEASGYNVLLIETVGVGQSETTVRSMVDFFLLILIAGAGDELQGIKRGVLEMADALLINKADGERKSMAELTCKEYALALKYLASATQGWETRAHTCSALTGEGIKAIWELIQEFEKHIKETGIFHQRRKQQTIEWVYSMIENYLVEDFYSNSRVQKQLSDLEDKVFNGLILPTNAAEQLLKTYYSLDKKGKKP